MLLSSAVVDSSWHTLPSFSVLIMPNPPLSSDDADQDADQGRYSSLRPHGDWARTQANTKVVPLFLYDM